MFDGHLLPPFAQWSQGLSLVFVAGVSLSLRSVASGLIHGGLIVVALTPFFMSMWTVHLALANAKHKVLARVRSELVVAREALVRGRDCENSGAVTDSYRPVAILGVDERQVLDAPTWPFNPAIVGRVIASVGAPLAVYLPKLAFGVGGAAQR